jgi:NTP pyrophosphatase (non-canonical NTP hydrolase)
VKNPTLEQMTELLLKFREARDWQQFHNPKDMALSLSLEVAELLELMQWRNGDELVRHLKANRRAVADELCDVLGWVLLLSSDLGIDLPSAFVRKLKSNRRKYPVSKARGRAKKYTEL